MEQYKNIFGSMRNKQMLMRISFGIIFFWFGALKFFPSVSPAEELASETIYRLTFGIFSKHTGLILLAILECGLGLMFLSGKYTKATILTAIGHMLCTFTPFFLLPEASFTQAPYAFTLVGQYIMKNIVFIVALTMMWPEPQTGVIRQQKNIKRIMHEDVAV